MNNDDLVAILVNADVLACIPLVEQTQRELGKDAPFRIDFDTDPALAKAYETVHLSVSLQNDLEIGEISMDRGSGGRTLYTVEETMEGESLGSLAGLVRKASDQILNRFRESGFVQ